MSGKTAVKPAVVLVHGWCANQTLWRAQVEHLARDHEVYTLDLGGHGRAETTRDEWTIHCFAEDVAAFIDAKQLEKVVLVGHSMGGAVCAEAAVLRPKKISTVVLADTFLFDYGFFHEEDIAETLAGLHSNMAESVRNLVYEVSAETASNELKDFIVATLLQTPTPIAISSFDSLLRWNMVASLPFIEAEIYAINGSKINPVAAKRYQHSIREFLMEGAGHFLHLEDPEKFNTILDSILEDA